MVRAWAVIVRSVVVVQVARIVADLVVIAANAVAQEVQVEIVVSAVVEVEIVAVPQVVGHVVETIVTAKSHVATQA